MSSRAWFVSIMFGAGLFAGCNLSEGNPTSPAVTFADDAVASRDASASSTKVAMCHRREDGTYHRLDLASPAAPAHRAHGDAAVGEAVPEAALMVFNEACASVPKTFVITKGSWVVDNMWMSRFDISGQDLTATGLWREPYTARVCGGGVCTGQTITVDILYVNTNPYPQFPLASGYATVGSTSYNPYPIEFAGPLHFVTQPFTVPPPESPYPAANVQVPFTLTGELKGYLVYGLRDAVLAFDVPVSGHGTATVRFLSGHFWSVRFDFEE